MRFLNIDTMRGAPRSQRLRNDKSATNRSGMGDGHYKEVGMFSQRTVQAGFLMVDACERGLTGECRSLSQPPEVSSIASM